MKKAGLLIIPTILLFGGGLFAQSGVAEVKNGEKPMEVADSPVRPAAVATNPEQAPSIKALGGPGKPAFAPKSDAVPVTSQKTMQPSSMPATKQDQPR